ncbi:hypothetical protein A2875_00285 [Candidatus Gottesmanbacteria bacterium RIFCSPHIGHO2_01_FULL_46_14]|uniref:Uncharacterized protein n=3 Tax=Candidatus Gottesmaniibacteriota TaxID=1752720 RepID=A0A1F5ZL73_9BACT|nr:MAG: hypothetical protein UY08_C0001G0017 [Candidatus Gottesmanbacteria bacterium GW2011_GWA1_47_8]OGG13123.1 MAG: hypothetical protein A2875_00285 [Candidatus Gottesmanbacteria bacterium RIFCSPHIGHO2_01_FULL_46_14]OGG30063.1 MAG: hypothetical protein A2971_02275 [Candidatus Gottesmanbacteria bacterium RIFCSPLOWO2_01_FULL_46_21]
MAETINESVSVNFLFNHLKGTAYPWVIFWRGRRYTITKVGLHHTVRDGRVLFHLYSVTDGTTFFHLRFDTENLSWKLLEISYDNN